MTSKITQIHTRGGEMRAQRVGLMALAFALTWSAVVPATARADTPTPAPTASASPTPTPTSTSASTSGEEEPEPLTPEQVKQQVAQADALQKDLLKANKEVAAASAALAALSAKSSAAMDTVATARAAETAARKAEKGHLARLKDLSAQAAAARDDVDHMAYDAYVNGSSSLRDIAAFVDLVAQENNDSQNSTLMGYLADARAADGRRFTTLAQAQRVTAKAAVAARLTREAATTKAEAAQKEVAASLAAQQKALATLQAAAKDKSEELRGLGVDLGGGVDLASLAKITTTPLCSDDTGSYPNGALPGTALCPVTGSAGHLLRPTAARAFDALKLAYEKDMGSPLCITDSYRDYAAQVDVKARKPHLAATPGTSNHGLGLAVDLCGGIESFGTPAHQWMKQHAPLFGWFHPAWAEPGGSKPEPWHWEYAQ